MILEALNFAATVPLTGKAHRRFIRYSVNLWSRANRCDKAWAEHEDNSKAAVSQVVGEMKERRTAVVLGSGLLRDVPIEALAKAFDTVVLVDLVHLASVRAWLMLRGYRNVRLVERDLSGWDEIAAGRAPEALAFLRGVPYLDLVVSANLLSQIGTGAAKRLETAPSGMPDDTLKRLIAGHIEGLSALPCRTCLITDIAFQVIDRTGQVREETDLLRGVPAPDAQIKWLWPVIPTGEESPDYQVVHSVIASSR